MLPTSAMFDCPLTTSVCHHHWCDRCRTPFLSKVVAAPLTLTVREHLIRLPDLNTNAVTALIVRLWIEAFFAQYSTCFFERLNNSERTSAAEGCCLLTSEKPLPIWTSENRRPFGVTGQIRLVMEEAPTQPFCPAAIDGRGYGPSVGHTESKAGLRAIKVGPEKFSTSQQQQKQRQQQ